MDVPNAIELSKKLIAFNTQAEHGEDECAGFLGNLLENNGFKVEYYPFAEKRTSLIARHDGSSNKAPLVFTGHIDVVPLGAAPWKYDPFNGETDGDRLYGRGSTDMKGGVAAFVIAAIEFCKAQPNDNVTLIITAGEETGCDGAKYLAQQAVLGQASAVVIGEPTGNQPFLGHRGALWVDMVMHGVTAHGSMPEEGVNAIYKAANAICKLQDFHFPHEPETDMGHPTLNVSEFQAGININSVSDYAKFCVDFRTVPGETHDKLVAELKNYIGQDVEIHKIIDLNAVHTDRNHTWVNKVFEICKTILKKDIPINYAPFFTDGSVLQQAYNGIPILILGPGITEMAHKTDEYIMQSKIDEGLSVYKEIINQWANG